MPDTSTAPTDSSVAGVGQLGKPPVKGAATSTGGMSMVDGKHVVARSTPEDRGRAAQVLQITMGLLRTIPFGSTPGSNNSPDPNATHRTVPPEIQAQLKAAGVPVPNGVVFDKAGGTAVGAFYVKKGDLGMGVQHQHVTNGPEMQHMWFVPSDLDLAFSDVAQKSTAIAAAAAAKS